MANKLELLFLLMGVSFIVIGASFLTIYYTEYDYSRRKEQYAEFWTVARTGGGDMGAPRYNGSIPLSADTSDLRVFRFSLNVSMHNTTSFWIPLQIIAGLNNPGTTFYVTNWTDELDHKEWQRLWENHADTTPRTITIDYMETILQVWANDRLYNLSLGRSTDICYTENDYFTGHAYVRDSQVDYKPYGGFMFYVADPNRTVLQLGRHPYNANGYWNFSLVATWNTSLEQPYGPDVHSVERAVVARWRFQNISNDRLHVSIMIDNTHYHPPVPVYTMIQRPPWVEASILSLGGLVIAAVYVYRKRFDTSEGTRKSTLKEDG